MSVEGIFPRYTILGLETYAYGINDDSIIADVRLTGKLMDGTVIEGKDKICMVP